jgi:hypothetical protein
VDSGKTLRSKPRDPAEMSGVCVCVCVAGSGGGAGEESGRPEGRDGGADPICSLLPGPVSTVPLCPSPVRTSAAQPAWASTTG